MFKHRFCYIMFYNFIKSPVSNASDVWNYSSIVDHNKWRKKLISFTNQNDHKQRNIKDH